MTKRERVLRLLESTRGDDLYRAKSAFRGLSAEEMGKEYGESGRTRAEIVASYEHHEKELNELLAYAREYLP